MCIIAHSNIKLDMDRHAMQGKFYGLEGDEKSHRGKLILFLENVRNLSNLIDKRWSVSVWMTVLNIFLLTVK